MLHVLEARQDGPLAEVHEVAKLERQHGIAGLRQQLQLVG